MIRCLIGTTCAVALSSFVACGSPPGELVARLHWPDHELPAAPSAVDELRFVLRGGDGFEQRAAVSATAGAWRSLPLAAGRYRLEAVAIADERPLLRAVTDVSVSSEQISRVDLQMEPLK